MISNRLFNKDIISIKDFSKTDFEFIFKSTNKISEIEHEQKIQFGKGRTLGYIFYEPSTRTRMSFEAAIASIGGTSIGIADTRNSSIEKGESLSDTIKIFDLYSDLIVLRHSSDGSSRYAAEISDHPVINAGSGSEEHPTQAMLDLYTIYKEKNKIDDLNIGIVGDLKYGRTVYSLLFGLANYKVKVHLISPPSLAIRKESIYEIENNVDIHEHESLDKDVISKLDILYVTRIQKERFPDLQEFEKVKGIFKIDKKLLKISKKNLSIMHPLPRIDEISHDIDSTNNAIYFKQAAFGKNLRSALLTLILNEKPF